MRAVLGKLRRLAAPGRPARPRLPRPGRLWLEPLEARTVPSVAYTPTQIVHAYGFDKVTFTGPTGTVAGDGTGQTIAIVDAYDDPTISSDLATFNSTYGLPAANLTKVDQTGGTNYPVLDTGWSLEIALDVEWAHAVAPQANILLVEATTNSYSDLLAAVDYASAHASVVSMSWGGGEFSSETSSSYDGHFSNKTGVTFLAASGDSGKGTEWPAVSPNVVSVGGTTLTLNSDNSWKSETGWGNGSLSWFYGGSGGGISKYETQPSFQKGVVTQSTTKRTIPDISYDADPNSGFYVYDTQNGGLLIVGGTSAGTPQWAALVAIANQGRALSGKGTLGSGDVLSALYTAPTSDFHDITSGNNGYAAKVGYDLVTGIGTPKADLIISVLVSTGGTTPAVTSGSGSGGSSGPVGPHLVISSGPTAGPTAGAASFSEVAQVLISSPARAAAPAVVVVSPSPEAPLPAAPAATLPASAHPGNGALDGGGGDAPAAVADTGDGDLRSPEGAPVPTPDTTPTSAPAAPVDSADLPRVAPVSRHAADVSFADGGWLVSSPGRDTLAAPDEEPAVVFNPEGLAAAVLVLGFWAPQGREAETRSRLWSMR